MSTVPFNIHGCTSRPQVYCINNTSKTLLRKTVTSSHAANPRSHPRRPPDQGTLALDRLDLGQPRPRDRTAVQLGSQLSLPRQARPDARRRAVPVQGAAAAVPPFRPVPAGGGAGDCHRLDGRHGDLQD